MSPARCQIVKGKDKVLLVRPPNGIVVSDQPKSTVTIPKSQSVFRSLTIASIAVQKGASAAEEPTNPDTLFYLICINETIC